MTIRALILAAAVLPCFVIGRAASATTYTVGPGGFSTTIQGAVNAAHADPTPDTIIIEPGTYQENIDVSNTNSLTIESDPATTTYLNPVIVDGGASTNSVFTLRGSTTALVGLVIQNGNGSGSPTAFGGGIYDTASSLTVDRCLIQNNIKGGMEVGGSLSVTNSSFIGNTGGIGSGLSLDTIGTVNISNCTFSNNSSFDSGAISDNSGNTVDLINCTFVGNSSGSDGAVFSSGGPLTILNSLFAGNTGGNCGGTSITSSYDLSDDGTCGIDGVNGNQIGVADPMIGSPQNNGGLTPTIGLLSGSPAIDAGDNTGAPSTDQRGIPRPFNGTVDIGAYEFVNDGDTPTCGYTYHVGAGTVTDVTVTYADTDAFDGIRSLQLVSQSNDTQTLQFGSNSASPIADGTYGVPPMDGQGPVVLTSTKSGSGTATDEVVVMSYEGTFADCASPIFTSIAIRQASGSYRQTFRNLSPEQGRVHLLNDDQGIDQLEVQANGHDFMLANLTPDQSADLDLTSAMQESDTNEVTLIGSGPVGSQAFALIGNGTIVRTGGSSTPGTVTSPAATVPGDLNGDGRVDVADAVLLLKAIVGERSLTSQERRAIGLTEGRPTTVADVVALLRTVVGE